MAYNVKNKYSTIMKTEIKKILYKFLQDGISSDDATQQVLDLFSVSGLIRKQVITDSASNELHLHLVLREHLVIWFNQKVLEGL